MSKPAADALMAVFGMKPSGFECRVPIVTASLNQSRRDHWSKSMKRTRSERRIVGLVLSQFDRLALPVTVTMTRCSPRQLDDDNLVGSFKHVRDEIAAWLHTNDANPLVTWRCEQAKATKKTQGTVIRVEERR